MKKGLYITYFYLPILVPRSIIGYKHLENSKLEFDVYTKKVTNRRQDSKLKHQKSVKIYRDDLSDSLVDKIKWIFLAKKFFINHQDEYDFVMTSFMPIYSLIPGLLIKKSFNIPWVSYYSDPPGLNINHQVSLAKRFFNYLERKFAKISYDKADLLFFTNQEQLDFCLGDNKIWRAKAKVLPHSYEAKFYSKQTKVQHQKLTCAHFGRLYGKRNINNLIEAISQIAIQDKTILNKIEIKLYGGVDDEQMALIKKLDLEKVFIIKDFVDYKISLQEMTSSDLLLLVDVDQPNNIFYPSKLADYFGSKRPIFGIVGAGKSTVKRLLKETNQIIVDNDSIAIKQAILQLINNSKSKSNNKASQYDSRKISQLMDKNIIKLLEQNE